MKRILASVASVAFLVLLCHCGSTSGGGTPPNDAGPGSGFVLSIANIKDWCAITVDGAALNATASYTFDAGTVVPLSAVGSPPGTFTFAFWTDTDNNTSASTTVTMDADKNVSACCQNTVMQCN
jgi:hypothetical protein